MFDAPLSDHKRPKFEAQALRRHWLARATPQFWLVSGVALFLAAGLVWGIGKALFGGAYRPLDVPDLATIPPQPTVAAAVPDPATPTEMGAMPWSGQMTLITDGALKGQYRPPEPVLVAIQSDWDEIVNQFLFRPVELYTDDLSARYTLYDRLSPTITPAPDRPPRTPPAVYRSNTAGRRSLVIAGCDRLGASCNLIDTWDDIAVARYSLAGDLLGRDAAPGWRVVCKAVLAWKDGRWRIKQSEIQVVKLATPAPPTPPKKK